MLDFLNKHKRSIIYGAVLLLMIIFFHGMQNRYYLKQDIDDFKSAYLFKSLYWIFGVLALGLLIYWLITTREILKSFLGFLYSTLYFGFIIFIFHPLFLGIALFANRMIEKGKVAKTYRVKFMAGAEPTKDYMGLMDVETGELVRDTKLINAVYRPGLQPNDIVIKDMKIGLLGIPYSPEPMSESWVP